MTEQDELHLERCRRYWTIAREVTAAAAATVGRGVLEELARGLGLLEGGEVVVEGDEELTVLFDHAIFDYRTQGATAVERSVAGRREGADEEAGRVLDALARCRYALLEVRSVAPGAGVWVRDMLSGEDLLLMDPGLGQSSHVGLMLASHVLVFEEFAMTTGAVWPVSPGAWEMIQATLPGLVRGSLEQYGQMEPEVRGRVVTMMLRFCLAGAGQQDTAPPMAGDSGKD